MSGLASKRAWRLAMGLLLVGSSSMGACSGEPVAVADNGGDEKDTAPDPDEGTAGAPENPRPRGCGEPGMASPCIDTSTDSESALFECGPIKCNSAHQYCLVGYGGIQGDSYSCVELPLGCRATPSCECADAPDCGECSVDGRAVTNRCAVG